MEVSKQNHADNDACMSELLSVKVQVLHPKVGGRGAESVFWPIRGHSPNSACRLPEAEITRAPTNPALGVNSNEKDRGTSISADKSGWERLSVGFKRTLCEGPGVFGTPTNFLGSIGK